MKVKSEQEMLELGRRIGEVVVARPDVAGEAVAAELSMGVVAEQAVGAAGERAVVIELIGDVGAGKTTFTRGLAEGLGVTEPVTSPSFTISKAYAGAGGRTLIHYDFYRLPDPGIMSDDLAENLQRPLNIVVIEWGDSVAGLLPAEHLVVRISYNDDGARTVEINR